MDNVSMRERNIYCLGGQRCYRTRQCLAPYTVSFIQDRLLDGFFGGILVRPIHHPVLYGLPGTFRTAIAMCIINPIVHEGQTPSMEHTLIFGDGQTNRPSPLGLPFVHHLDRPPLPLVLTRTSQRLDGNQVLERIPDLWDRSGCPLGSPKCDIRKTALSFTISTH